MPLLQETEPPIVSRLWSILQTLRNLIAPAINAGGIADPVEVLVGYPTWTEGAKVWAQAIDPGFVTIDALPDAKNVTKYHPQWAAVGSKTVGFTAVVSGSTVTFSATSQSPTGTNIHFIFSALSGGTYDAQYTAISTDNQNTVATAIESAINYLGISGVSASAAGNVVTVSGMSIQGVNVCGTYQAHKEVRREARTVQISIWTNSPWSRYQIHDAISSTIGAVDNCWITLPDGGRALVLGKGERFSEQSQSSYNIYEAHLTFYVEYGVIQRATAYEIGLIDVDLIMQNEVSQQTEILIA